MRAIQTKYLPVTYTKPSRIKAYDSAGDSVTVSTDGYTSHEKAADDAARQLAIKMGWDGKWVKGGTKTGNVYVSVDGYDSEGFTIQPAPKTQNYNNNTK